jgi:hypothetical protein
MALPLCAMALFRALHIRPAAAVTLAALVTFSPGIVESALHVHSDLLFLDVVMLSMWGLVVYVQNPGRFLPLIVSGALAGCAYAIRNVGLAFLAAGVAFFFAGLETPRRPLQRVDWRGLCGWLAAAVPIVLALKIRSLILFGKLEPYTMPPSDIGVVDNVRWMLFAVLSDATALRDAGWLAWNKFALAAILVIVALAVWRWSAASLRWLLHSSEGQRRIVIMLIVYCATGFAMLIATRTLYDWKAIIDERYATQYTWVLLTLLALAWPALRPPLRSLVAIGGCALLATRAALVLHLFTHPHAPIVTEGEVRVVRTFLATVPGDVRIVSNEAPTLRFATERDIRQISARNASPGSFSADFMSASARVRSERLYGIFVANSSAPKAPDGVRTIASHGRLFIVAVP